MYKDHFHLNEMPFSIAPNPRFLFMSEHHREAMAHLLYGVHGEGGIVLLTGEVGTGKTTICRNLMDKLPENIDVALILNPRMSVEELLQTICEEFHIDFEHKHFGIKSLIDALNAKLLASHALGRRAILIVDEAQNLAPTVLEQLRLLTNLETSTHKLLQICLIGQPELQVMLSKPDMRQVSQRVVARYHLPHLNLFEVKAYVSHRLSVSGASPLIFPESLIKQLYQASGGVPRIINLICDRALLGAYVNGEQKVSPQILRQAVGEVLAKKYRRFPSKIVNTSILAMIAAAVILSGAQLFAAKFNWMPSLLNQAARASTSSAVSEDPTKQVTSPLKWPDSLSEADSEMLAYRSLFKLFNLNFDTQSRIPACDQAAASGMRCFASHGNLSDLFQLDQPALLQLPSSDGKIYFATLTALDHQTAILMLAGVTQQVTLNELVHTWNGQFIALWKSPPDYTGKMPLNTRGPAVVWLRHAMQRADNIADNGSDVLDMALAQRIRAFQLSEGIKSDGVAGPLTLIRLNLRIGQNGPLLHSTKAG